MKFFALLPLASLVVGGAAIAQTTPTRPAPPATMSAPNTERSSMTTAAEGTGTVVTDYSKTKKQQMRDGQPKAKTTKMKASDGTGKMKTKM